MLVGSVLLVLAALVVVAGAACWLAGSVATGLLYERSIPAVIAFSMSVQIASIPIFIVARRKQRA